MKYMLLIYQNELTLDEATRQACYAESTQLANDISAAGQYLGASPLRPTAAATSVRVRDGKRLVTDGPFAETREQLGGYYLVDVEHLDQAIDIAARTGADIIIAGMGPGSLGTDSTLGYSGLAQPSRDRHRAVLRHLADGKAQRREVRHVLEPRIREVAPRHLSRALQQVPGERAGGAARPVVRRPPELVDERREEQRRVGDAPRDHDVGAGA